MNLTRLRMLSEIAGRGSFRAAALALDYSPSAVSQQIALLEREAGVRLVSRGPRGAAAHRRRPSCSSATRTSRLRELAKARRALDGLTGNGASRLRVAAFPTATATIVALAVRSLAAASPDGRCRWWTPSRRAPARCWTPARSTPRWSTSSSPADPEA